MGVTSVKGRPVPQRIPRRGAVYYIRRVIPVDLRPLLGAHDKWVSLRTKDYAEARGRYRLADIRIEAWFDEVRQAAKDAPTTSAVAQSAPRNSAVADEMMLATQESAEFFRQLYPEDENTQPSYEEWLGQRLQRERAEDAVHLAEERRNARLAMLDLFDGYADQPGLRRATVQQWRAVVEHLVSFLGHDNALAVRPQDIRRWRDHLVTEPAVRGVPRKPKTINDAYLAAVRAVFAWGVDRDLVPSNPAQAIKPVRQDRQPVVRERDLTREEQETILKATLAEPPPRLGTYKAVARRWVPWLCAYTGARVNEITQARKQDVAKVDGVWTLKITPEAGATKTNRARVVPLHEHLIEQGFLAFVEVSNGPLFYEERDEPNPDARPRYKLVGNRLAEWVRDLGLVDVPQPNHSWRHTFKTISRKGGMPEAAADYLQGHAPANDSRGYGSHDLATLAAEIAKMPRFLATAPACS